MPQKPTTIDEYLASVSDERRRALESLRKTIRSVIPEAEECISYGMPAFRLHGVVVAGFSRSPLPGQPPRTNSASGECAV